MEPIRILCFGDSITWGYHPERGDRMGEQERWTGVLQDLLGEKYRIIEEGQNSRTIATDDPTEGEKNGIKYIIPCIESQRPLDLMILMLGTNDTKKRYCYSALDIAGEMEQFLEKVQVYNHFHLDGKMKILLVAPPVIRSDVWMDSMKDSFDLARSARIMEEMRGLYRQLAETYGCDFLDASEVVAVSSADGVHLDQEEGRRLAEAFCDRIQKYQI